MSYVTTVIGHLLIMLLFWNYTDCALSKPEITLTSDVFSVTVQWTFEGDRKNIVFVIERDGDSNKTITNNSITFDDLYPGEYKYRVIAKNSSNNEESASDSKHIVVANSLFWRTFCSNSPCVFVVSGLTNYRTGNTWNVNIYDAKFFILIVLVSFDGELVKYACGILGGEAPTMNVTILNSGLKIFLNPVKKPPVFGLKLTVESTRDANSKSFNKLLTAKTISIMLFSPTPGETYKVTLTALYLPTVNASSSPILLTIPPQSPTIDSINLVNMTYVNIAWSVEEPSGIRNGIMANLTGSMSDVSTKRTWSTEAQNGSHDLGPLIQGERYRVELTANYENTTSQPSNSSVVILPPTAPTNLDVSNVTTTNFAVTWTHGPGVREFYIINISPDISSDPGEFERVSAHASSIYVTTGTPSEAYNITITASSFNLTSAESSPLEVLLPPASPTIESVTLKGSRCTVTWSTIGVIDKVRIEFRSDDGYTHNATSTSLKGNINVDLLHAQRYSVEVVTESNGISSAPSQYSGKVVTKPAKAKFSLSSTTAGQVKVSYNLQNTVDTLAINDSNGKTWHSASFTNQKDQITLYDFTPGQRYTLTLITTRYSQSIVSDPISIVVKPARPSITSAELVPPKSCKVVWTTTGIVDKILMTFSTADGDSSQYAFDNIAKREKVIALKPAESYTLRLVAQSQEVNSEMIEYPKKIITEPAKATYSLSSANPGKVTVKWDLGSRVDRLQIHDLSSNNTWLNSVNPRVTHSVTIPGFTPGQRYTLRLTSSRYGVSTQSEAKPVNVMPSTPSFTIDPSPGSIRVKITGGAGVADHYIINLLKNNLVVNSSSVNYDKSVTYSMLGVAADTYEVTVYAKSNGIMSEAASKQKVIVEAASVHTRVDITTNNTVTVVLGWSDSGVSHFEMIVNSTLRCYQFNVIINTNERMNSSNVSDCDQLMNIIPQVSDKTTSFELLHMVPDTDYHMSVTQYANGISNAPVHHSFRTNIVVPGRIIVTQIQNSSTFLVVYWNKPKPRPGPTNYTIRVLDKEEGSETFNQVIATKKIIGYYVTVGSVMGLNAYWKYEVTVVASTSAGSGLRSEPIIIRTNSTKPSQPRSVTVVPIRGTFTKVKVIWQPPEKKHVNAHIIKFVIRYRPDGQDEFINVDHNITDWPILKALYETVVTVKPETVYSFRVYAVSVDGLIGQENHTAFFTPAGPPPPPPPGVFVTQRSSMKVDSKTSSFPVQLYIDFFNNAVNGRITERGLIVSSEQHYRDRKRRAAILTEDHYAKMYNWYHSEEKGFVPYRATPKNWKPPTSGVYVIGDDISCDSGSKYRFCNGPVDPDIFYYVKAFICTKGGCTETVFIKVAKTQRDDRGLTIGLAVGLTLAVLVIIVLVLLVLIWYRRGQRSGTTTKVKSEPDEIEMGEPPEPNHPRNKPIAVSDFATEVARMHNDSDLIFSTNYRCIHEMSPRLNTLVARASGNTGKNRYTDILPFDGTRVKLLPLSTDPDESSGDYINANFITGESGRKEYIAAQGPLPATVDDFIRMVWEQNISVIVMLTKCEERGLRKCEAYWPSEEKIPTTYGDITVELVGTSTLNSYTLREMELSVDDKVQRVKQFHYLSMMDHDTTAVDSFIDFIAEVRSHIRPDNRGPILVHCSAGVGRTGTFIAVDRLRKQILSGSSPTIDVYGLVLGLRHERTRMVQTESQYVFIFDCVTAMLERKQKESEDFYGNQAYLNVGYKPDEPEEPLYENSVVVMKTEL